MMPIDVGGVYRGKGCPGVQGLSQVTRTSLGIKVQERSIEESYVRGQLRESM
jgi:hypothetical protein